MTGTWKNKKWRRVMRFICETCGKEKNTFVFNRSKNKICLDCAKKKPNENQRTIFDYPIKEERIYSK